MMSDESNAEPAYPCLMDKGRSRCQFLEPPVIVSS